MPGKLVKDLRLPIAMLLSGVVLQGCAGHRLLTTEPPVASPTSGGEENHTILYERVYHFLTSGGLTSRTHTLVRVGSHGTEEMLGVFDGSVEKLAGFEARVIHADGSVEWYDKGDLWNSSLSNSRVIAEQSVRYVVLKKVPRPGDLIEVSYEHDLTLPQLGTLFTIGESGPSPEVVRCSFEVPDHDSLFYAMLNDSLSPLVTRKEHVTEYAFTWVSPPRGAKRSVFAKTNDEPGLIAVNPARGPASWKAFGDWYITLSEDRFRPDDQITAEAKRITRSDMTDVEKMNAIAEYCQSSVRYEQVYLARGEFIPNAAPTVLAKRFGDCKDYTCLMVSMARSLGLDAHPALCHRGRRFEVCETLPVSQFNHMIAHLRSGGKDHWYDGTNQSGTPGITADDLVNARALIVEKDGTRFATIPESRDNLLSIVGTLHAQGASLSGKLRIRLTGQYAVGFLLLNKTLNEGTTKSVLVKWLQEELSSRMMVSRIDASSSGGLFDIEATCEFPNSLVQIDATTYLQFDRVFDNLIPAEETGRLRGAPYIFPDYARVVIGLNIPELRRGVEKEPFHWDLNYALPPGPFAPGQRASFQEDLRVVRVRFGQTLRLSRKE